eukprot:SAG31_NODE_806_length_11957_cov_2.232670_3_plen_91_part_00
MLSLCVIVALYSVIEELLKRSVKDIPIKMSERRELLAEELTQESLANWNSHQRCAINTAVVVLLAVVRTSKSLIDVQIEQFFISCCQCCR